MPPENEGARSERESSRAWGMGRREEGPHLYNCICIPRLFSVLLVITLLWKHYTLAITTDYMMIDQAGSTPEAFPYNDLHGWGVRQVVAGGIDCSSYLSSIPGGPWYDSEGLAQVAKEIETNRAAIKAAHADNMQIFLSSDLFQFPTRLLAHYKENLTWPGSVCLGYKLGPTCIDIRSNTTRTFLQLLFDEIVETFPDLDGVVLRYGENSPCNEHSGNAPYNTADPIPSLQLLLQFLRQELCVQRNLTVIFRTWDTSTELFHANATFYTAVTDSVDPHPRLVFSIKHTALDFWRRVSVNPTLAVGKHKQVVEAEIAGMYFACGTVPLYIANGLINGFSENNPPVGMASLFLNNSLLLGGLLTNHQCDQIVPPAPYFWPRLEQAVISSWAANTSATEEVLFDNYISNDLGVTDPLARAALRQIALSAMDAHLHMWTVEAFDPLVNPSQMDRPTANWFVRNSLGGLWQLDPRGHESDCHAFNLSHCMVFPFLGQTGGFDAALAEKKEAAIAFAKINQTAYNLVAPSLRESDAKALLASTEIGAFNANIVSTGWTVMALGWQGENNGGKYNVSAIKEGIELYDSLWQQYLSLPNKIPGYVLLNSLLNDTFWVEPSSGQPGMRQSIDRYRNVSLLVDAVMRKDE